MQHLSGSCANKNANCALVREVGLSTQFRRAELKIPAQIDPHSWSPEGGALGLGSPFNWRGSATRSRILKPVAANDLEAF